MILPLKSFFLNNKKDVFLSIALIVIICFNCHSTFKTLKIIHQKKQFIPLLFRGSLFKAFQQDLRNIDFIGYVSDRDIHEQKANEQFSQAQYMLAPTILDPTSTDYEYLLIANKKSNITKETLIKLNVMPVRILNNKTMLTKKQK